MIGSQHNPAGDAAKVISAVLTSHYQLKKQAAVYFDGLYFTSNANRLANGVMLSADNLGITTIIDEVDLDPHGMLRLAPLEAWVIHCIETWPESSDTFEDEDVQAFVQRLSAHLAFGFVDDTWQEDAYLLALRLLRSHHVKSQAIRADIRQQIMTDYDRMVRDNWMPEALILALINGIQV